MKFETKVKYFIHNIRVRIFFWAIERKSLRRWAWREADKWFEKQQGE